MTEKHVAHCIATNNRDAGSLGDEIASYQVPPQTREILRTHNNLTANKTETFVIQRMPLPKLIEPPQHIQFLYIGQRALRGEAHEKTYTPLASDGTIRPTTDLPISENLMAMLRLAGPVEFVFGGTIRI